LTSYIDNEIIPDVNAIVAYMHVTNRMEQISIAYVMAIASVNGYTFQRPNIDDDSIDTTLSSASENKPRIDIQLKSTTKKLQNRSGFYSFALSTKNYNDLRADCCVPRILVVLQMPDSEEEWLKHSSKELAIRECAFWASLYGEVSTANQDSITIKIPCNNVFCPNTLKSLMTKISKGEKL